MTQPDGAPTEPTAIEEWVEDLMLGHFDEIQSLPAILAPHIAERITAAVQDERERITRHARVAVAIADADDRTEWQRGYRAAADRLNAILNTYTDGASDIPQETPVGATLGLTEPARDGLSAAPSSAEESAEDAARRFARHLERLRVGLVDAGLYLKPGTLVADVVTLALEVADGWKRERQRVEMMAEQRGKILDLCAATMGLKITGTELNGQWWTLDPEAVRAALSSPVSVERGPETPEDELLRAAAWRGAQELEELGDEADDGERAGQRLLVLAVDEPVGSVWRAAMLDMVRAAATEEGLDLVAEWRAAQAEAEAEQAPDEITGDEPTACRDLHGRNCEPPSELCCYDCTEAAHDTFPIHHADGSACSAPDLSRTEVDHG